MAGLLSEKLVLALLIFPCLVRRASALDLSQASVVSPPDLSGPPKKAVAMLIEEVDKRTQIRWVNVSTWLATPAPVIAVGMASELDSWAGDLAKELAGDRKVEGPEGYRIRVKRSRALRWCSSSATMRAGSYSGSATFFAVCA